MPASRRRNESVPSTSNSGRPAEKPSVSMRRLAGSRYTRRVCSQGVRTAGERGGVGEVSDMGPGGFCLLFLHVPLLPLALRSAVFPVVCAPRLPAGCGCQRRRARAGAGGGGFGIEPAQAGARRNAGELCRPAVPADAAAGQGPACTGTRRAPAAAAPACHCQKADPACRALERPSSPVALGGQPHRQLAGQCLLHARRQDCVLHRHP